MADLLSLVDIPKAAGLVAPGLIILGIRSRFRVGIAPDLKEKTASYAVTSAAYLAGMYPLFNVHNGLRIWPWLWQLQLFFVIPVVIGLAVVVIDRSEWFYKLCRRLNLKPSHHIPAAWDFAFSGMSRGTYVLVRLANGKSIAGLMGSRSFASSAREERDLLIQEVWDIPEKGTWKRLEPARAILICGKDIQSVELFHGG